MNENYNEEDLEYDREYEERRKRRQQRRRRVSETSSLQSNRLPKAMTLFPITHRKNR